MVISKCQDNFLTFFNKISNSVLSLTWYKHIWEVIYTVRLLVIYTTCKNFFFKKPRIRFQFWFKTIFRWTSYWISIWHGLAVKIIPCNKSSWTMIVDPMCLGTIIIILKWIIIYNSMTDTRVFKYVDIYRMFEIKMCWL